MNRISIVENAISEIWPVEKWRDYTVLIGVSGGPDSVCLARLMDRLVKQQAGAHGHIEWVHVNHGTRPECESEQNWVAELAERLTTKLHICQLESSAAGSASEESLRDVRYFHFEKVAAKIGARYVLTAHHADDQIETIFHRIFRGTGVSGLKGIPVTRPLNESTSMVRPLIQVSRKQILGCLEALQQDFLQDASNEQSIVTRNQIRNQLLPLLREALGEQIDQSLLRLGESASEIDAYLLAQASQLEPMIQTEPGKMTVCKIQCRRQDALLIRRQLLASWHQAGFPAKGMSRSHWNELSEWILADVSQNGKNTELAHRYELPGPIRVSVFQDQVVIESPTTCSRNELASTNR